MPSSVRPSVLTAFCGIAFALLSGCGGSAGGVSARIGGTVSGLASGSTLALSDGHSTALTVVSNGAFVFDSLAADKSSYSITVRSQPAGQTCSVTNGSGTVNGADVSNVQVTCVNNVSLSGTVSGLPAGTSVTLGDGRTATVISANGAFTLASTYPAGGAYNVNVSVVPTGTNCTLANGVGSVGSAGTPVTNLAVTCTSTGTLGGMLGGLAADNALVLSDGVSSITVSANGAFAFADVFSAGASYAVTQVSQTGSQTCTISNSAGTFDASATAINTLVVVCE